MGNLNTQYQYLQKVQEAKPGETAIYRQPVSAQGLFDKCEINKKFCSTIQEAFLTTAEQYPDKEFLGTIEGKKIVYKTYRETKTEAELLGSGIIELKLTEEINEYANYKLSLIGVFSKNRYEWMVVDIANCMYRNTLVPIYDTLGPASISYVLNHSGIKTCFCEKKSLDTLLNTENLGQLKILISFDAITEEQKTRAQTKNIKLLPYKEVLEAGKKTIHKYKLTDPDDIFTFSYTSGTSGQPKGVMISNRNVISVMEAAKFNACKIIHEDVYLSYLPLPHVLERIIVWTSISVGSTVCFYQGDPLKIKEDLALVRPTIFAGVPRIFTRFYSVIKQQLDLQAGIKKYLINQAIQTKLQNARTSAIYTHKLYDQLVFNKIKSALGGRVRFILNASAPLSNDIQDFFKICMCCPFINGYGQTESTGGSICTSEFDPVTGHIGGPATTNEVKLIDVPEQKYLSTDVNAKGEPSPRGEICLRGPSVFQGYYKDPEKTKEALDSDGWLHTGDIGEIKPDGRIYIIDRKKNIFKLQQAEYVAPEKVESVYSRVKGVQEIWLYGDSYSYYCIAFLVPNKSVFLDIAKENKIEGTYEELCKNPKMNDIMLQALNKQGKDEGLYGFEQAKKLYIEPKSFAEYGCMTNTMKIQRHNLTQVFKKQIEQMYSDNNV